MNDHAPVPRIDCELCHDLLEGYLVGQVGRAVAASIERHYFDCGPCFELLQTYRAAQVVLQEQRSAIRSAPWRRGGLLGRLQAFAARMRRRGQTLRRSALLFLALTGLR